MTRKPSAEPVRTRGASWTRSVGAVALVPLVALLAACGAGSGNGGTAAGGPLTAPSGQTGQGGQGGQQGSQGQGSRQFPGASGLIAAVSTGLLQVQSTDAQTTVTYTKATRFTRTVKGTVAVGQCVVVTGAPVTGSADSLTATSVRIEAKVNGACPAAATGRGFGGGQGGFGGGQGGSGSGSGSSAAPRPSGAPSGQGFRDLAFATGTVSAVSGPDVTVQGVLREGRASATATASPTQPAATAITVRLASTTSVTQTVAATSASAVVGQCATAIGTADDRGDIAASTIAISTPDPTSGCRAGLGGFGFPGRGSGSGSGSGSGGGSGGGQGA